VPQIIVCSALKKQAFYFYTTFAAPKMNIGIFTIGTRGDVQPYLALALGLAEKGHNVTIAAPENFRELVESSGINFHPLYGNAEEMMDSPAGKKVVQTGNGIKLMKFFYEALHAIRHPLRQSCTEGIGKVDYIIANLATLPIVSAIAEKQNKKMALTYFMPPVVPTDEFPMSGLDFMSFKAYNKLSYKLGHAAYWKFVKEETNEFRQELGLQPLKENLVDHIGRQKLLDLYCISPSLIPQPADWDSTHKITGFLYRPANAGKTTNQALNQWLANGPAPIYVGFGSNGVGENLKIGGILREILTQTNERVLFCTGWALYNDLPQHPNLFVTKYADHDLVFPKCKVGVFHGGAGTLCAMLRNDLPVIIVSFYTDQPTWGKIIVRKGLGAHIPAKKLTAQKLMVAIDAAQASSVRQNVLEMGERIRNEDGVGNTVSAILSYFEMDV
jgi:sterol 3beta-glucosyltransferase